MSTINVNTVLPQSGNTVNVNGLPMRSLPGTPGSINKYIGTSAPSTMTGTSNLMLGSGGSGITSGFNNTVLGLFSGGSLTQASDNVAIGVNSLAQADLSSYNVAIGTLSLFSAVSGVYGDVGIGYETLRNLTSPISGANTVIGYRAMYNALTSGGSAVLGGEAGYNTTTGQNNVFLGRASGINNTTGSNNVCLGLNSNAATATTSDSITLGNNSHNVLRCAVTTITSLSDARDKEEIAELAVGLEFVKELNPVSFVWNDREEDGKHGVKDFGFIAQDLKSTQEKYEMAETLGLVYEENPEKLEASYGKLIPILVQAIKELSAKVEALENK
jgi:hypothetical protein